MKKYLILVLFTVFTLILASCGGDNVCRVCEDKDVDGFCDVCGGPAASGGGGVSDVLLIEDGVAGFNIIISDELDSDIRQTVLTKIRMPLKNEYGIEVEVVTEGSRDDTGEYDVEVLVGPVASRGEKYFYDGHTLGKDGYVIKIVDSRVIINAGSTDSLRDAIGIFASDILGIGEEDEISTVIMMAKDAVEYKQSDYSITDLSVAGKDMRGYEIFIPSANDEYREAAEKLQTVAYEFSGYWFDITESEPSCGAIRILPVPKRSGPESFSVYTLGEDLYIECAWDNMLSTAMDKFLTEVIMLGEGRIDLSGRVFSKDVSVVYYEDFGAVGDGVTNDFEAIYLAHEFANLGGQTVRAKDGAKYYISDTRVSVGGKAAVRSAVIKTNVEWGNAEFIIDDRELSPISGSQTLDMARADIVRIIPDDDMKKVEISSSEILSNILAAGLNPNTKKIDLKLSDYDGPLLIVPESSSHRVFRRRGFKNFYGSGMRELIVLDKDGNVSSETPIMFDYTTLDRIDVYKIDESRAITVSGGKFTTRASRANLLYYTEDGTATSHTAFVYRGISVERAHTTLLGVEHYVTDEVTLSEQVDASGNVIHVGPSYYGFIFPKNTSHVTLDGCTLTGRRCYIKPNKSGHDGTYDFYANNVNKLVLKNCNQSNFWITLDGNNNISAATSGTPGAITSMSQADLNGTRAQIHWGVGGTNFCKNMEYIGSTLSRFDAHSGLCNGKIIDSTVNYIELTGCGKFTVENVDFYAANEGIGGNAFISLRADYGSTWDGEITVKDLRARVFTEGEKYNGVFLLYYHYVNWYFGYVTAFPSFTLDGARFFDINTGEPLERGFEIKLTGGAISESTSQHLETSHTNSVYMVIDSDGDGFIDEPIMDRNLDGLLDPPCDLDGDGVVGNTLLRISDYTSNEHALKYGVEHPSSRVNLNITRPPREIKIINNEGGYVYVVRDTSKYGLSDGGYYDDVESFGGFFGDTKFIYGNAEDEYTVGTKERLNIKNFRFE